MTTTMMIPCDNAIAHMPVKLTVLEKQVLLAYSKTEYGDGLGSATWCFSIIDHSGLPGSRVAGVLTSLQKKGLIEVDGAWRGDESSTWLEPAGIIAVQAIESQSQG